jgi:hypothetical protein
MMKKSKAPKIIFPLRSKRDELEGEEDSKEKENTGKAKKETAKQRTEESKELKESKESKEGERICTTDTARVEENTLLPKPPGSKDDEGKFFKETTDDKKKHFTYSKLTSLKPALNKNTLVTNIYNTQIFIPTQTYI